MLAQKGKIVMNLNTNNHAVSVEITNKMQRYDRIYYSKVF